VKPIGVRTCLALLVLGLASVLFGSTASAAPAQANPDACFPGSDPDYPPTGGSVQLEASLRLDAGHFVPGGSSHIVISGATGGSYCGQGFSTPFILPAKDPDAQGRLIYDVATPADFELGEMHHIDVFKQQVKVGNFDFCVNKKGDLAPDAACHAAAGKGKLAKTGADRALDIVKVGGVVLAIGVGALYLRRRRLAGLA
jgi:LPXTG-motif cell wall-anchored protein